MAGELPIGKMGTYPYRVMEYLQKRGGCRRGHLPRLPRLKQLCTQVRDDPGAAPSAAVAARVTGMSQCTFGRRFEQEAGMSYAAWSRSAKNLRALAQIAKGDSGL